jgi:chloramphenicol-sensitive protein RarD
VLIAINWTTYVYGVETGHLVEISLGYYLNPLHLDRPRRGPPQVRSCARSSGPPWAVGLPSPSSSSDSASAAFPYLALTVALSFGLYGLVKNKVGGTVSARSRA